MPVPPSIVVWDSSTLARSFNPAVQSGATIYSNVGGIDAMLQATNVESPQYTLAGGYRAYRTVAQSTWSRFGQEGVTQNHLSYRRSLSSVWIAGTGATDRYTNALYQDIVNGVYDSALVALMASRPIGSASRPQDGTALYQFYDAFLHEADLGSWDANNGTGVQPDKALYRAAMVHILDVVTQWCVDNGVTPYEYGGGGLLTGYTMDQPGFNSWDWWRDIKLSLSTAQLEFVVGFMDTYFKFEPNGAGGYRPEPFKVKAEEQVAKFSGSGITRFGYGETALGWDTRAVPDVLVGDDAQMAAWINNDVAPTLRAGILEVVGFFHAPDGPASKYGSFSESDRLQSRTALAKRSLEFNRRGLGHPGPIGATMAWNLIGTLGGATTVDELTDATAIGRTVVKSVDAAAVRTAIAAEGTITTLPTSKGGTGLAAFTSGTFLTASSTSALASVKTAPAGVVVGTTDTQTLTNKTLSGASNTLSNIPQSAVTNLSTDLATKVDNTRTVAGKALSSNVTINAADIADSTAAGRTLFMAADVSAQRVTLGFPDLNVKMFGALGNDGAADDTAAIQAAIDAASFGQNVFFPRGIYRITAPLQMKLGTTLVGVGAARFAHYQTTTGANTSAPAIGSVIRVGSSFTGAAAVMATASASPGYTTGATRLRDIVIDGRGQTATAVDGFQATGILYDARLERVTVLGMSGNGIKFQADGSNNRPLAAQLISVMVRGCAGNGFDLLFADSYLADCYALSNGTTGSTSSGFVFRRFANTTVTSCRSEWNGRYGYHFTGLSGGGGVMTACVTDRNNWDGIFCDGTGDNGNILFTGIAMRRDGRNGASGGGGYAGFRTSGSTQAIVLTGFTITPGIDDDGTTGTLSPEIGIRASNTRSLSFSDGVAHAATTPIVDSGGNSYFGRGLNVQTATGTITSPTYQYAPIPTVDVVKSGGTWPARPVGVRVNWIGADPDPTDMVAGDTRDVVVA